MHLGDEVRGDLDINGDGHIGEKLFCDKCCIAEIKSTRKAKHFTFIGLQTYLVNLFFAL